MKINFYLDKPQSEKTILVIAVSLKGKRIRLSTGISVNTNVWDKDKQRIKPSARNSSQINAALNHLRSKVEAYYHQAIAAGNKTEINEIQNLINELTITKQEKHEEEKTFLEQFLCFIEDREKSSDYKEETTKHYRSTLNHLKSFQKHRKQEITYNSMNKEFFKEFNRYLSTKKMLTVNSASGRLKDLRTFLYFSLSNNLTTNTDFIKAIEVRTKESQAVALNEEDLEKLEKVELEKEHLRNTKNLFLIQLYTGIRYSDLANMKRENIDLKNGHIVLHQVKTQNRIIIPVHSRLREILSRYPDLELRMISNQKYNKYLKEVCRMAGIDQPIQQVWYYGKKRKEEIKPKYKMISSHSARRSYITLSLKKGALPEEVMAISGHKDRKTFEKYVKIAKDEAVERMKNLWED